MKLKQWQNIFHVIVNLNSIVQHVIRIRNVIIPRVNVNVKIIKVSKRYSWNPSTWICENSKYLKSVADTSVSECDEIVVALFITANLKQLIYLKKFWRSWVYIKKYCLNFQPIQDDFFLLFLFNIYKMVDMMDVYKSLDINIGKGLKNIKMIKFVPDHLKTKNVWNMQLKNYLIY